MNNMCFVTAIDSNNNYYPWLLRPTAALVRPVTVNAASFQGMFVSTDDHLWHYCYCCYCYCYYCYCRLIAFVTIARTVRGFFSSL